MCAVLSCLVVDFTISYLSEIFRLPPATNWSLLFTFSVHHLFLTLPDSLRYVNCARNEREQNLVAFQYQGGILFRCSQPIEPGQELMMWYEEDYAKDVTFDYLWNKKCSENSYVETFSNLKSNCMCNTLRSTVESTADPGYVSQERRANYPPWYLGC